MENPMSVNELAELSGKKQSIILHNLKQLLRCKFIFSRRDGLSAYIGHCPQGALTIIEREANDFNEKAIAAHVLNLQPRKEEKAKLQ